MRIAVVGAGAVGGLIAAALARAGNSVGVVARGAHLEAIRSHGLAVESQLGNFTARVDASDDLRDLGAFEAVLLTFKAHQWDGLLDQVAAYASTAAIVTMQNGLPFWFLRNPPLRTADPGGRIGARFADSHIVGGVVHSSGTILRPGTIRQSGGLRYPLGEVVGGESERLRALIEAMRAAGLAPESDPNIRSTLYLKLVNNAGLNPVSALTGLTVKPMLDNPVTHAQVRELMAEALLLGQALGVVAEVDLDARIAYAARLADVKTSMLQDLEARRPLELDPIIGVLVELGERLGVPLPRLSEAYARLQAIQRTW